MALRIDVPHLVFRTMRLSSLHRFIWPGTAILSLAFSAYFWRCNVLLEAQDETGKKVTIEAEDLLARVFQHELDHLNGTLIVDHASVLEKIKIKKRLKELKESVVDG